MERKLSYIDADVEDDLSRCSDFAGDDDGSDRSERVLLREMVGVARVDETPADSADVCWRTEEVLVCRPKDNKSCL